MKLVDRPNFILTPHVAWASAEAVQAVADQLIDNIEAFQRGKPANDVAREFSEAQSGADRPAVNGNSP
jgi:glycerate dehydrogenase